MNIVCPECKNDVDLTDYPSVDADSIIECNMCGITLQTVKKEDGNLEVEIIDEGK